MKLVLIGIFLVAFLGYKVACFKTKRRKSSIKFIEADINMDKATQRFAEGIKIPTISFSDYNKVDWSQFEKFRNHLEKSYPQIHSTMEKILVNEHSLVYKWIGSDDSLKPVLITAHQDVVPIEEGTENDWKEQPFSGAIVDDFIWGRGTLDTKITIFSAFEAAEYMISKGLSPKRTTYFAFGHDEEVGGTEGALKIAELFEQEKLEFEYVIDEGGCVVEGALSNIPRPIGYVGIGEKGYANIRINTTGTGGHSSMPPKHTSLGNLAKIISKLEKNQMKLQISKYTEQFLSYIGPEMSFLNRVLIANLWLFRPVLKIALSKNNSGNALLRTTTAATMANASMEPNVLPQSSSATFNFRIAPHDSTGKLMEHIENVIKDIPHEVDILRLEAPSEISPINTYGFHLIEECAYKLYPDALVAPYIVMAGTDARKYENVCENIYRFTPYSITNEELGSIHSTNERISLENYKNCIDFFINLISGE
ncbi:M20/M25/M40 family metallo-hydrolase [Oceanirhabdus seepicola]|uniref:M20/M25/M40 family metallo-hydrolase n=1 Tax=Oceanirhabdus seepicola TaxID=2828781 RepID=A0A9J6NVM3_9CLOT|nr:M20/M25/M40 family metallo-hydrolase [Oceanirhabdus seepicola]MCM1988315.1 M20/M25/M40 family metallo-hydrolase [Oceanirhabdus seepicola]